jgi:hypothetical protein
MDARGIANFAHDLARIDVSDDDFGGMRCVEAVRGRIHYQVVPASVSADLDFTNDVIIRIRRVEHATDAETDEHRDELAH